LRFLPYIPWLLQALLLWLLIRRHAQRAFPFFFAYAAFGVAAGVARFSTLGHVHAYFWTYWITDAVYILLGTLSLFEVFRNVLGHVTRVWWRHVIFPGIIAASVYLTMARMQAAPPHLEGVRVWIISGEIAVRFAQVITFATLVSLTPLLGLYWDRHSRGIAGGFGMFATIMLWMTTKYSDSGIGFARQLGIVSILAYALALIIWIWAFRRPKSSKALVAENPSAVKSDRPRVGEELRVDSKSRSRVGSG
jgi:hypothetical protein